MLVPFTMSRPIVSGKLATTTMSFFDAAADGVRPRLEEVQPGDADPIAQVVGLMLVAKRLHLGGVIRRAGCAGRGRCYSWGFRDGRTIRCAGDGTRDEQCDGESDAPGS